MSNPLAEPRRGPFAVTVTVYDETNDKYQRIKLRASEIASDWEYETAHSLAGKVAASYPTSVAFSLDNLLPNGLGDFARTEQGKGRP